MKTAILLSAILFGSELLAAENLLTNADFDEGMTGWWSGVSATMKAAGCRQGVEKDGCVAVIPDTETSESAGVLLGHGVNLQSVKTYRLAYALTVEQGGTMRHLYQMSHTPYRSLGLVENIPVEPGTTGVSATFLCTRPDNIPAHITFNLSKLKGKWVWRGRMIRQLRLSNSTMNRNWDWTGWETRSRPSPIPRLSSSGSGGNGCAHGMATRYHQRLTLN